MISKHTNTSLIFIAFRSQYFFAAQYFHKGLHCGVHVPECMFPLFFVYVFMGILLYCFFGEEVLWKFLNSVLPSKSLSVRLNWKASPLRLYVPAGSNSYGRFCTSHAVVYLCQRMLPVLTLNYQNVFRMGCLGAGCCVQGPTLVLRIRQCDSLTRANLGTVLNQYGVRDRGVSALRGRMFPFTPISFLLLSLSFFPFFHISSTFVVLSLPN